MFSRASTIASKAAVPALNHSSVLHQPPTSPRITATQQQPFATLRKPTAVAGANGSQGTAYVAQVLTAGNPVVAITQTGTKFEQGVPVTGVAEMMFKVGVTPHLTEVKYDATPNPDEVSFIIGATKSNGVKTTIDAAPKGSRILLAQNGVDAMEGDRNDKTIAYAISTIVTNSLDKGGTEITKGGKIQVGANNPFLGELLKAFGDQKVFSVDVVKDIDQAKWEKIAMNCSMNTTCTAFGITLSELTEHMSRDPRMKALVDGLAFEALQLATAIGVNVNPHPKIMDNIAAIRLKFPGHPTSMQSDFNKNIATEIPELTGGVAKQTEVIAKRDGTGIEAPLSSLISKCILELSEARKSYPSSEAFRSARADWVQAWQETLLDATNKNITAPNID